ncbi:hypothetical protein CSW98_05345 [Vibrio sp. HA2012]|uniref:sensor histidine kinase n=1 Tax=Vibrio sp. HA2012 TaxID=1971595 RepID=UPI000C2C1775|nr:HAMP domain-containing sensor histidine kinase [Vibrio sp. HA2012]PJC87327.1 hypothetical protein CSW98_05345 [Vibrio sp. HA2012]
MISWFQKQKLIHQIGVVILSGFAVSFFLSFCLLSSETSKNMSLLSSSGAVQRVISVVDILSRTPVELHDSIISASRSSDLSLSISSSPHISATEINSDAEQKLIKRLNEAGINQVHLSMVQYARPAVDMNEMHNAMLSGHSMHDIHNIRLGYIATVEGAVELKSGAWLNFSSGVQEDITRWSVSVLFSLGGVMLSTIFISLLIIQHALKPVGKLREAADNFAMNKKVFLVEPESARDLYPTIQAFNAMQTQLADYIRDRTKLLAAIAHDLRTPLTTLRLRLEFIDESEDKQQMLRTVSVMENMLLATMQFAREESRMENRQYCDINSLIQTIVDEYTDKHVLIQYQPEQRLSGNIPPLSIRRMVENLLNNSVQYGGEDNQISLVVNKEHQSLTISVVDTGIGIDERLFDEMVKPFTRLNEARDTDSSNVGLGLSITASIAQAYGGRLVLKKNLPKGLIAMVSVSLGKD